MSESTPPHPVLEEYYRVATERHSFVGELFDGAARYYNHIGRMLDLGSGPMYRRQALQRAGLKRGMRLLDVATGTGLVAREAAAIAGRAHPVIGVDPSFGMLRSGARPEGIVAVRATAERLPFPGGRFDFLSLGFALRHMSDLAAVFTEFHRVLKPGGTVCVLELTRPEGAIARGALKTYMRLVIPALARVVSRHRDTPKLFRYFWDTIEACVPPEAVMATLKGAGFADVRRTVELGIFSEYTGRKA